MLHVAAGCGSIECLNYLLELKGNVKARDILRRSPLHYAAQFGTPGCVRALIAYGAYLNAEDEAVSLVFI